MTPQKLWTLAILLALSRSCTTCMAVRADERDFVATTPAPAVPMAPRSDIDKARRELQQYRSAARSTVDSSAATGLSPAQTSYYLGQLNAFSTCEMLFRPLGAQPVLDTPTPTPTSTP